MTNERFFCPNDGTELTDHIRQEVGPQGGETASEGVIYGQCPCCGMEWKRMPDLSVVAFDNTEYCNLFQITKLGG